MNKFMTPITSTLLANKLKELTDKLQSSSSPNGTTSYQTLEQTAAEAHKILSQFYRDLASPITKIKEVYEGTEPSIDDFNTLFESINRDLNVIYSEFENLEGVILGDFNYMTSRMNRLSTRMKQAASRLGDYTLYSTATDPSGIYFTDSFNNLEKIEIRSPLLKEEQAEVQQEEGIITLPINRATQRVLRITQSPVINSNSNGIIGNNYDPTATLKNNTITTILDGNADTWFEYERVVNEDDGIALILDFTVNLGKEEIVNFIRINPNNFGTKTQIEITALGTSEDGKLFDSIDDDLLASDLYSQEENSYILAPSTSKYSGQGLYSFTPRKAKYVRISLKQSTPYKLSNGKIRYAIGIRDIYIESRPYKDKGEFISRSFSSSSDPIRKLILLSTQSPSTTGSSTLGTIDHSISTDNGVTWTPIRPKITEGEPATSIQGIPELLDFNGVDENTIKTSSSVTSIRYRANLARNSAAFTEDNPDLARETVLKTETFPVPSSSPYELTLSETPINGTIRVVDPFLGSRGKKDYRYSMRTARGDNATIRIPWDKLPMNLTKTIDSGKYYLSQSYPESLYIDGDLWTRGKLSGAAATDKTYQIDVENKEIKLGDGTTGKAPAAGALIELYLDEERLFPSSDNNHTALFSLPFSPNKREIEVYSISKPETKTMTLSRGIKKHILKPYMANTRALSFSDTTVFSGLPQTYINGDVELTAHGHYSIDYDLGIVYSYDRTSTSSDTTVTFKYTPRTLLSDTDYDFTDEGGISNSINIKQSGWTTLSPDIPETVPTGVKYFNLINLNIVEDTVVFSGGSSIFGKEVPFVDGRKELLGVIETTEQLSAIVVGAPGIVTLSLSLQISSDTSLDVGFTDLTVFTTLKSAPGDVTVAGDYYIYRTAGNPRVIVYVDDSVDDPGYITYYYVNNNASLTGIYSINYKTGEVYTSSLTTAGITVDYKYANYVARYPIAREIDNRDIEVNLLEKKIIIGDQEIIKKTTIERGDSTRDNYRVSYHYVSSARKDITELQDYYTPVLMDYVLKVITESRLS